MSVAVPAILIVVGMAVVASEIVAGQLRQAATDSARQNVEAIVRGYVDPTISEGDLDIGAARNPTIDAQLQRLIAAGEILRINIWSRDGRVAYSTEADLRGQRFSIGEDLALAFSGQTVAMYEGAVEEAEGDEPGEPGQAEPHGLVLEVYVPIRGSTDGNPFGVYEVYEDAGPDRGPCRRGQERRVPRRARRGHQPPRPGPAGLRGLVGACFGARTVSCGSRRPRSRS